MKRITVATFIAATLSSGAALAQPADKAIANDPKSDRHSSAQKPDGAKPAKKLETAPRKENLLK